jgi:hypothetical protein
MEIAQTPLSASVPSSGFSSHAVDGTPPIELVTDEAPASADRLDDRIALRDIRSTNDRREARAGRVTPHGREEKAATG